MSQPLGKQLLGFRILTKKRAYLALGLVMLPWYALSSFRELTHGPLGVADAYAVIGLLIAIAVLFVGWKMPSDS
ncbi:hypothetical protein [Hirschia baltica]|uniref:Uncharacterized protein n=1 Tax=Hirschia baltica (strain ATCC 49814 / DSM 5838 / IFAM 1418) TaxID=582402 RepID=C6XIN7_HIRBI|nr:hypothetical protein [Hirschia baltica]ACT58982.1 hypothetical protein Hbal_1290 [Hirschia baltica ATCC 49814]